MHSISAHPPVRQTHANIPPPKTLQEHNHRWDRVIDDTEEGNGELLTPSQLKERLREIKAKDFLNANFSQYLHPAKTPQSQVADRHRRYSIGTDTKPSATTPTETAIQNARLQTQQTSHVRPRASSFSAGTTLNDAPKMPAPIAASQANLLKFLADQNPRQPQMTTQNPTVAETHQIISEQRRQWLQKNGWVADHDQASSIVIPPPTPDASSTAFSPASSRTTTTLHPSQTIRQTSAPAPINTSKPLIPQHSHSLPAKTSASISALPPTQGKFFASPTDEIMSIHPFVKTRRNTLTTEGTAVMPPLEGRKRSSTLTTAPPPLSRLAPSGNKDERNKFLESLDIDPKTLAKLAGKGKYLKVNPVGSTHHPGGYDSSVIAHK